MKFGNSMLRCCLPVQVIAINQDSLGVAGDIIWKVSKLLAGRSGCSAVRVDVVSAVENDT
jgi:hypothetical protein